MAIYRAKAITRARVYIVLHSLSSRYLGRFCWPQKAIRNRSTTNIVGGRELVNRARLGLALRRINPAVLKQAGPKGQADLKFLSAYTTFIDQQEFNV